MLGIVAALRTEARSLGSLPSTASGLVHLSPSTLVYIAGMGAEQARVASEVLIRENASALLSWGSAGALHPKLSPGNLILPKRVIDPRRRIFATHESWHSRLVTRLVNHVVIHTEPLTQSLTVLRSPAEKSDLGKENQAIAVDMESGSVAEVAEEANLPFMAIRAIVDSLEQGLPESAVTAIGEGGQLRPLHLLASLARKPSEFLPLIRMRHNFIAARTTLTTVAQLVGDDFLAF